MTFVTYFLYSIYVHKLNFDRDPFLNFETRCSG